MVRRPLWDNLGVTEDICSLQVPLKSVTACLESQDITADSSHSVFVESADLFGGPEVKQMLWVRGVWKSGWSSTGVRDV